MKEEIFDIFRQTQKLVSEVTGGLIDLNRGGNLLETTFAAQIRPGWVRRVVKKYAQQPDPSDIIGEKNSFRLLRGERKEEPQDPPPSPPAA